MPDIHINSLAPDFNLMDQSGQSFQLSDYSGQYIVLYFYPKDNTPGCTTQALEFSAQREVFAALNAIIIGISRDSTQKHHNFTNKHSLTIRLGADIDGTVCNTYGVWVEKKLYGRQYMGIERSTFLIDPQGKISALWRKVKVKNHAATVYNHLQSITAPRA